MTNQDLELHRTDGEQIQARIQVRNPTTREIVTNPDLSGAQFWFYAKRQASDADADASLHLDSDTQADQFVLGTPDGTTHLVPLTIVIHAADYGDLRYDTASALQYELQMRQAGAADPETVAAGTLTVTRDIVRAIS